MPTPPTTHLSLVIDPAGETNRPGINLQIFSDGSNLLDLQLPSSNKDRTANGSLIAGGNPEFIDFSIDATLQGSDFQLLRSLYSYKLSQRNKGLPFETVVYNLLQPFVEISAARTRRIVPGTTVISSTALGLSGLTRWVYWVAVQGVFDLEWTQTGELVQCKFTFTEGTKLLA